MDFTNLKIFMDDMTRDIVPGNTVRVYYQGKEVFGYSSGYSDLENKIPMQGDELLNIYSCSKVTTAVAALQLLEQGKYLLHDPLYEYIPEYREMYIKGADGELTKAQNPITVWNLFTMTAGFTYNMDSPAFERTREETKGAMDTVVAARNLAQEPLSFEPGTRWQYSLCHDVLAALVEVISGKRFCDYVQDNIFAPLDIKNTWYHRTPEIQAKIANTYQFMPLEPGEKFDLVEAQAFGACRDGYWKKVSSKVGHVLGPNYDSGGAGIVTSVPEYGKLAAALACGGTGANGGRILASGTIELMKTNQLTPQQLQSFIWPQLRGYGYGLGVRTLIDRVQGGSNGSLGEIGWGGAAGANLLADPATGIACFYSHHMHNPQEGYYQPRLRNALYSCF